MNSHLLKINESEGKVAIPAYIIPLRPDLTTNHIFVEMKTVVFKNLCES